MSIWGLQTTPVLPAWWRTEDVGFWIACCVLPYCCVLLATNVSPPQDPDQVMQTVLRKQARDSIAYPQYPLRATHYALQIPSFSGPLCFSPSCLPEGFEWMWACIRGCQRLQTREELIAALLPIGSIGMSSSYAVPCERVVWFGSGVVSIWGGGGGGGRSFEITPSTGIGPNPPPSEGGNARMHEVATRREESGTLANPLLLVAGRV